jgi:SRSO17 transposase
MPETIAFQTKTEIAFGQINAAQAAGLPQDVVLMDAGYGNDTGLRTDITALGLRYATAKLADIGAALTSRPGEAALRARGFILAISEGLTQCAAHLDAGALA